MRGSQRYHMIKELLDRMKGLRGELRESCLAKSGVISSDSAQLPGREPRD